MDHLVVVCGVVYNDKVKKNLSLCKVSLCVFILVLLRMGESFVCTEVNGCVVWDKSLEGVEQ
jgi:hypothetical protein